MYLKWRVIYYWELGTYKLLERLREHSCCCDRPPAPRNIQNGVTLGPTTSETVPGAMIEAFILAFSATACHTQEAGMGHVKLLSQD